MNEMDGVALGYTPQTNRYEAAKSLIEAAGGELISIARFFLILLNLRGAGD
jgi:hypothetical protein